MRRKYRVYVWQAGFLADYTDGLGVVIARSVEEARELLHKQVFDHDSLNLELKVYELGQPLAFYTWGGS